MSSIAPSATTGKPGNKIVYIDHLKVILTVLVILHHTFITYGAPGGWYYFQKTTNEIIKIPMTLFVAVNQSFFMGFFFFLSALFVPSSYNKKGPAKFIKDRVIRLGVPLIFYSFILGPAMNYLVYYFGYGHHITFIQYLRGYDDWIDFGVLWFAAALLLFTLLYVAWRSVVPASGPKPPTGLSFGKIILFAAGLGAISFLVRLIFPIGWILKPVGFQLGHFTQYIMLFIAGTWASKYNWLAGITNKQGRKGVWIAMLLVVIVFPLFYMLLETIKFPSSYFSGGLHWPALMYALWEQLTGLAIITALIAYGKRSLNGASANWGKLSRSTFAVYIFHPLVVISLTIAFRNINVEPALKLLFVAPLAVTGSFLLGRIIVAIPGVNKII
ncbi:acyltransferase family protein [Mucilaginibacter ginsenosidivorans]|uniref:Acyltransferase n=1 Tax=Mucilaginibacter ginsenosidivorans TaxID=398053 RepID=A0A5B8UVC7_9SPHI|nr:acyltransferase [Mucilaginibacter ginsenosidivorans]QEC62882.1 acyltransferase [Mucilaginibacter ginsenosidivorans]